MDEVGIRVAVAMSGGLPVEIDLSQDVVNARPSDAALWSIFDVRDGDAPRASHYEIAVHTGAEYLRLNLSNELVNVDGDVSMRHGLALTPLIRADAMFSTHAFVHRSPPGRQRRRR